MKKRRISILTFTLLLIAICLTGCAKVQISTARIQEFTEVAENIKDNPNYILPEGFTVKQESTANNDRIVIMAKGETNKKKEQKATFNMTGEKPVLEKIEEYNSAEEDQKLICYAVICFAIIVIIVNFFISA